ncbi:winged helix-turn-helix transcriptional regulator [Puteibacter caeruleilacunae]|nr:winged helix-turn-helix transcriptional regulator [Puteibacter caeruleilacunae]
MTIRQTLDSIDHSILDIITKNARTPFKDVAEVCGVSRAAVHQRVNRMIEMGVITGSGYHINPKKIEFRTCTYMGIFLDKAALYTSVSERLRAIPEVVECHYTTGQYSMFIKLYARDNEHLKEILNEKLQKIKGIVRTDTIISLEETFKREVPIPED